MKPSHVLAIALAALAPSLVACAVDEEDFPGAQFPTMPPMPEAGRLAISALGRCPDEDCSTIDVPLLEPTASTSREEFLKYHGTRPRSISLGFVPDYGNYDAWHRFAPGWYGSPYYYDDDPTMPYGVGR